MKKLLIVLLVLMLSVTIVGCFDGIGVGNGDDSTLVWDEYSNDYLSLKYPPEWEYEEGGGSDYLGVEFWEEGGEFELYIGIEKLDEGLTKEDFINEIRNELEDDNSIEIISEGERAIYGQDALEVVFKENEVVWRLEDIYYNLNWLAEEEEIDKIGDYIAQYNDEEDFIDSMSLEELENIKELLLDIDSEDVKWVISDIDELLDAGTLELWFKVKGIVTAYNGNGIIIGYGSTEEVYSDKIQIIDDMIDSIKFVD